MYLLLLLLLAAAEGVLFGRFLYRREVDWRPGAIGLFALAAGAIAAELLAPGGWQWLDFAGPNRAGLDPLWAVLCLLGAALGGLYLFLDRPLSAGKLAVALALACAAACALQTVAVVDLRIDYPFDLEWIEGGILDHAVRIRSGAPLYQTPDVDYVPSLYAPLYMRLLALFPYDPGAPYWTGRMLSMVCVLSTGVLVYHAAAVASRSAWIGLVLSLCLLGGALFVGDWFDLLRVDSLFLLLAVLGFVLLDRARGAAGLVAAGAVFAASVYAKQAGAFLALAAAVWVFAACGAGLRGRAARLGLLTLGGLAVAAVAVAVETIDSGGMWRRFFIEQLGNYPVTWTMFVKTVGLDLLGTPGVVLLWGAAIGLAVVAARDRHLLYREPMVVGGLALLLIAVLQRAKWGGAENCLMPMLAGCLLLAAHGLRRGDDPAAGRLLPGLYLVALVGFLWHMDLPGHRLAERIPSAADLRANRQLLDYVKSRPGPVVDPTRSHLVYQARGEMSYHEMFAFDWAVKHPFPEKIARAYEERWAETLILRADKLVDGPAAVTAAIRRGYTCKENLFRWPRGTADAVAGWRIPAPTFCIRKP